ncbi:signal peptidase II [Chloroflexi bacterium TSY]|nr:signal peptidase II [Chloroflexi bacterium TSY]
MNIVTEWLRKAWPVLFVAAIIIVFDQLTKIWVRANIPKFSIFAPIESLEGYFDFQHVDNYGAAFGILQNQSLLFVAIAVVVVVAILIYVRYLPMEKWAVRFLLGLQLGGAVGNLIDRLYQGFVTDFVRMGVPGVYYWPNYNVADSAIVIGVIGLGIYVIGEDIQQQRQLKASETAEESV